MPGVNPYTNVNATAQISINSPASSPQNKVQVATVSGPSNSGGLGYGALGVGSKVSNALRAAAGETPPPKPENPPEPPPGDLDSNPDAADAVEVASLEAAGAGKIFEPTKQNEKSEAKPGGEIEADGERKPAVPGRASAPREAKPAKQAAAAPAVEKSNSQALNQYYKLLRSQMRALYNRQGGHLSQEQVKHYTQLFQELSEHKDASPRLKGQANYVANYLGLASSSQDTMKAAQSGEPKQFKAALNNHVKNYIAFLNARQTLLNPKR